MNVAIMQPYFFPFIGYFQLIHSVDLFVLYDNVKYTKKGWVNRNRILINGQASTCTLPLRKQSDYLDIRDREIAESFDKVKFLNQIKGAYGKAPYFIPTYALIEKIINFDEQNLFRYLHLALKEICRTLNISTVIKVSSEIEADHKLKGQSRVIAICKAVGASSYINASGGQDLYSSNDFNEEDLALNFILPEPTCYPQFGDHHVPWLSIIDVMMFNSVEVIKRDLLEMYKLV